MLNNLAIFGAKYLFLFILATAVVWFFKQPRSKQKEILLYSIVSLPIIYAVLKIAALFYFDARPFVVGHFAPLLPHEPDNGFPSDHTILSAAAASIVFPYNKKIS